MMMMMKERNEEKEEKTKLHKKVKNQNITRN